MLDISSLANKAGEAEWVSFSPATHSLATPMSGNIRSTYTLYRPPILLEPSPAPALAVPPSRKFRCMDVPCTREPDGGSTVYFPVQRDSAREGGFACWGCGIGGVLDGGKAPCTTTSACRPSIFRTATFRRHQSGSVYILQFPQPVLVFDFNSRAAELTQVGYVMFDLHELNSGAPQPRPRPSVRLLT